LKLAEAVGILNECRHRGGDDWIIGGVSEPDQEPARVVRIGISDNLTAFEAIAVAEKYKEGETPESIMQDTLDEIKV
jgi:methylmalonyl-CoA mutase cobalamin-binding subunit